MSSICSDCYLQFNKCWCILRSVAGVRLPLVVDLKHSRKQHAKLHSFLVKNGLHRIKCCLLLVDCGGGVRVEDDSSLAVVEFVPTDSQCAIFVLVIVSLPTRPFAVFTPRALRIFARGGVYLRSFSPIGPTTLICTLTLRWIYSREQFATLLV